MHSRTALVASASTIVFYVAGTAAQLHAQYVIPVSRVLHAQASAGDSGGSVADNPADQTIGAVAGNFSQSASATSPMGFASGSSSTSSTVTPAGAGTNHTVLEILASGRGQILGGFPPVSGSGSSSQQIVLDVPNDLMLAQDVTAFSSGGGFAIMSLKIENDSGGVFLDRTYAPGTVINNFSIFLPADRYLFSISASDFIHASGSSGGTLLVDFKAVPSRAFWALVYSPSRSRRGHRGDGSPRFSSQSDL